MISADDVGQIDGKQNVAKAVESLDVHNHG